MHESAGKPRLPVYAGEPTGATGLTPGGGGASGLQLDARVTLSDRTPTNRRRLVKFQIPWRIYRPTLHILSNTIDVCLAMFGPDYAPKAKPGELVP